MPIDSPLTRLFAWGFSVFFHALYHSLAWAYDGIAAIVSVGRWHSWILSVIPYLTGPRILEIGYGTGHLQLSLVDHHLSIMGIDQSRQMGRITQRKLNQRNFSGLLVNGMAQHLPYREQTFNQVVATFPTPYIFDQQTLEEIFRILAPGGSMIVLLEAWITGTSPVDRIAASIFRILGQSPDWNDSHLQPFSQAGFTTRVNRHQLSGSETLIIEAVKQKGELSSAI